MIPRVVLFDEHFIDRKSPRYLFKQQFDDGCHMYGYSIVAIEYAATPLLYIGQTRNFMEIGARQTSL